MMYDLEPFYHDDDPERGTWRGEADDRGRRPGDIDLGEVLATADGHHAPSPAATRDPIREVPVQWTCDVCGCPLDDVGVCPRCQLHAMLMAGRLKAQQRQELFFREIEQIVEASWQS